eukprot:COSAG02_NODE_23_length_52893_cov_58.101868_33_plen_264_part_00
MLLRTSSNGVYCCPSRPTPIATAAVAIASTLQPVPCRGLAILENQSTEQSSMPSLPAAAACCKQPRCYTFRFTSRYAARCASGNCWCRGSGLMTTCKSQDWPRPQGSAQCSDKPYNQLASSLRPRAATAAHGLARSLVEGGPLAVPADDPCAQRLPVRSSRPPLSVFSPCSVPIRNRIRLYATGIPVLRTNYYSNSNTQTLLAGRRWRNERLRKHFQPQISLLIKLVINKSKSVHSFIPNRRPKSLPITRRRRLFTNQFTPAR